MSLSIKVSNSSNSLHIQPRQMAISSITSSPFPISSLVAPSPSDTSSSPMSSPPLSQKQSSKSPYSSPSQQSFSSPPYAMSLPTSPDSPNFRQTFGQRQKSYFQQQKHTPYSVDQNRHYPNPSYTTDTRQYGYYQGDYRPTRSASISSVASANANSPPLTLQERRQRNKAASAKYRAKKNQQHGEMRMTISSLTKENDLLQRQLDHIRRDNEKLKATCDKLRGKMMAEKMLKRLLNNEQQQPNVEEAMDQDNEDDSDLDEDEEEDHLLHLHQNNRFEEDIDFEDEDTTNKHLQAIYA